MANSSSLIEKKDTLMKQYFFAISALFIFSAGSAHAEPITNCKRSSDEAARLSACTVVIQSSASTQADMAIAFRNRGEVRLRAGATDQAIGDFTSALGLNTEDSRSFAGRARARVTKKDLDGAISDFTAALQFAKGRYARGRILIGRGYTLMVKGLADQAISNFNEAIRLDRENASAYNHRGLAYRKKGENKRAIQDYTAAITLNPVYALAYNNRGYVYESLGQRDKAIADFNRALLLDSSLTGAFDGLKRLKATVAVADKNMALISQGKATAETKCQFCHAVGETGKSPNLQAPQFRNLSDRYPVLSLRVPLSRGIAAPHDVMPKFTLTEQQVDGLIAYINSLNR